MRLLLLGGTCFFGRAVAEAALARGHEVTTFNRGRSGEDAGGVTAVRGDRDDGSDLDRLASLGRWDAVVDTSGFVPRVVGRPRGRCQVAWSSTRSCRLCLSALRHWYASVLLDAGESIKAVSEYLGHASAAFTLATYTHLMPTSEQRTRKAVDLALGGPASADGPTTARANGNGSGLGRPTATDQVGG